MEREHRAHGRASEGKGECRLTRRIAPTATAGDRSGHSRSAERRGHRLSRTGYNERQERSISPLAEGEQGKAHAGVGVGRE